MGERARGYAECPRLGERESGLLEPLGYGSGASGHVCRLPGEVLTKRVLHKGVGLDSRIRRGRVLWMKRGPRKRGANLSAEWRQTTRKARHSGSLTPLDEDRREGARRSQGGAQERAAGRRERCGRAVTWAGQGTREGEKQGANRRSHAGAGAQAQTHRACVEWQQSTGMTGDSSALPPLATHEQHE